MNLPDRCTQDMVDEQCSPIAKGVDHCAECDDLYVISEMHPWRRNMFDGHGIVDCYLCESCTPKCQWLHVKHNLDYTRCGRIQSPTAQGPWCAEHEKEAEALDAAESEE
jgi:hypothetical protein